MKKQKLLTLALASSFAAMVTAPASASTNPFSSQTLGSGYPLAQAQTDAKTQDGKCGEGKCGAEKKASKAKDGKCGEGKCGANKKAKEGSCGGDKKKDGSCGAKKS